MGWIPEQKRTKDEPVMMALCGQLVMFDNGAFQEKKSVFMLITLCGLCPVLLVSIICLAGPNIGLISGVVLIFVFCIASFNMFPRKVSSHRHIVWLGASFCPRMQSLTFVLWWIVLLGFSSFGSLCPSSSIDCHQSRSHQYWGTTTLLVSNAFPMVRNEPSWSQEQINLLGSF